MSIYANLNKAERLLGMDGSERESLSVEFDEKLRKNKKLSQYFTTEYGKGGILKILTHSGQKWDVMTRGSDLILASKGEAFFGSDGKDFKEFNKIYDAFVEVQKLYKEYFDKFRS